MNPPVACVIAASEAARGRRDPGDRPQGAPAEATEVVFLDSADGASALSLLTALGRRARSLWVALTGEADATGLIREPGHGTIAAGSGSPVACELFRAGGRRTLDPKWVAEVPPPGDEPDVLEQRSNSKWFQVREDRSD